MALGSSRSQSFDSSDGSTYARDISSSRQQPQHDNSFWRSKVGRKWSGGSNDNCDAVGGQEQSTVIPVSSSSYKDDNYDESEDVAESASSYTGIFSSVFDVAREAVSILNGPSSRYYSENRGAASKTGSHHASKTCSTTSLHLVDTLYLF